MPICTVRVCTVRATAAAGACAALLLASGTPAAQAARVAQAAQAGLVAQAAQTARASVPGWRIVSTDHRAGIDLELAVAAIGRRNAWAGGGVSPSHTSQGRPFAEHWNGRRWRTSRLPGRLSGAITLLRTSAWNNVWAFGGKPSQPGAFALRWNGHRWLVKKRWPGLSAPQGAVVFGPANVWVFNGGNTGSPVQHYNGHRWQSVHTGVAIQIVESATALPDGDVWALVDAGGIGILEGTKSGTGYTWSLTLLPQFTIGHGGEQLTTLCALTSSSVWALGGDVRTVHGHDHWFPLAAHWDGASWRKVKVSGNFTLGRGTCASDGRGGLWVTTGWDSTGIPPHLLRFAGGRFTRASLPPRGGRYVGVFGLAAIPGTVGAWGAGALTGLGATGPTTGVILKHGR